MKEIVKRAIEFIKYECKTTDPFELCDMFGFNVKFKEYSLDAMIGTTYKLNDYNACIYINSNLSTLSQIVVCAHELGHALLHDDAGNYFNGEKDFDKEYDADLFAAYLLLDESKYNLKFENMNYYILHNIIDRLIN